MAKQNPSIKKSTTTTLKVEGLYDTTGILLDEDGNTWDLLALLQMFKDQEVKITVKNVQDDEE